MPVNVLPRDSHGGTIGALRLLSPSALAFGATATTTVALGTPIVRISADIDTHFAFGTSPTAATTGHFLPAKLVEYVGIIPGDLFSVISATGAGAGALGTFYTSETI